MTLILWNCISKACSGKRNLKPTNGKAVNARALRVMGGGALIGESLNTVMGAGKLLQPALPTRAKETDE